MLSGLQRRPIYFPDTSSVPAAVSVTYGSRDSIVPPDLSARVAAAAPGLVDPVMFGPRVVRAVVRLAEAVC